MLLTGTPAEVLARIVVGDPLGLRQRIATRLVERALLLDVEVVLLRTQVLCALAATSWRGDPEIDRWLELRVEEALASGSGEAVEGEPGDIELRPAFGLREPMALFASPLDLDSRRLALACAHFNRLPFEWREAFFVLVLDGAGADGHARRRGLSLTESVRRARVGLDLFRKGLAASSSAEPPGRREPAVAPALSGV